MKRSFAWLLASVLLLSGCSMVRPQETTPPETTAPPETEPPAFVEYQPAHSGEVLPLPHRGSGILWHGAAG